MPNKQNLEMGVAALGDLPREELAKLWAKAHGCPPPKGVKRGLLERSAAWQLQAKMLGGLSPETRRALKAAMRRVEAQIDLARSKQEMRDDATQSVLTETTGEAVVTGEAACCGAADSLDRDRSVGPSAMRGPRRSPKSTAKLPVVLAQGARLMREWNGRQHFVDVLEKGYVFDGKTYRSLSAVAKRITGAHWSGPRFFGL